MLLQLAAFFAVTGLAAVPRTAILVTKILIVLYGFGLGPR
jgi:hypothetical protein